MDFYTLILACAGLAGFVLEWRRDNRREQEQASRVAALEEKVADLESWRDRTARAQ